MDCLDCSKFLTCSKKSKGVGYKCSKFEFRSRRDLSEILDSGSSLHELEDIDLSDVEGESSIRREIIRSEEKTNVYKLIESVLATDLLTPVDTKLDDSSIKPAENFFQFSTGDNFLAVKPYAFQMLYVTQLFAEYCPRCSDIYWMKNDVKVDDNLTKLKEKIVFLEFGVCPKCGTGKSELVKNGELNFYQELAGLAGQRCITADSVVLTEDGLTYVEEFDDNIDDYGYSDFKVKLRNKSYELEETSSIFKLEPEEVFRIELENGVSIEGTKEHPIMTNIGYYPLCQTQGLKVPMSFAPRDVFGKSEVKPDVALFLGYWLRFGQTCSLQVNNGEALAVTQSLFTSVFQDRESPQIIFDYASSFNRLSELLDYAPNLDPSLRTVPKLIRSADRQSVILFLSAFFSDMRGPVLSVHLASYQVLSVITLFLQVLGIKFVIHDLQIVIDGSSNEDFTSMFGLPRVENFYHSDSPYSSGTEQMLKVVSVSRGFIKPTYDFVLPETHSFIANGIHNHNSGKSAIVAMCCAYLLHKHLKMQRPNDVYGLLSSNVLHSTFVALTYKQAAETLWEPFLAYVTDSPFFNAYHDLLDWYGKKYGDEFYKIKDTYISYKSRRLLLYGAGPNKKTLRGRCLVGSTMVNTNLGFYHLSELVKAEGQMEVLDLMIDSHNGNKSVSHTYKDRATTIKIETVNGFTIEGTPEHPMLVLTPDLTKEWVPLSEIKNGDLIVSWSENNEPMYGSYLSNEPEFRQEMLTKARMYGYQTFVDRLTPNQDIPLEIRSAPFEIIHEFLESHFEYNTRIASLNFDYDNPVVEISGNQALIEQIHTILFHAYEILGKRTREQFVVPGSRFLRTATLGVIRISGDDARLFFHKFSRARIQKWRDSFDLEFKAEPRIAHYEAVTSVKNYKQKKPVFDVTVPDGHAFTANCLVSHNTRAISAIDEIGWFDNDKDKTAVKMNANEVYVALDRSLLTVRSSAARLIRQGFDDIPNGYAFNISSPSSARDKIVELVNQSKTSKKIFGFKRATWEMNPNITKEDLSEEYAKDPESAERDYACNPPLSDNAFFSSFPAIEDCFVGKPNKISYKFAQRKGRDGTVTRYAKLDKASKSTKPNVMALDAGYSSNSFALALGHLHEGYPILTSFAEVAPNPGMPLNHALIFDELINPLIKERNVKLLISDRWQNIKLLQDAELNHDDLTTISYSLKYNDFWVIKQTLFDAEAIFPRLRRKIEDILTYDQSKYPHCFTDPVEHLALQLMTVRDLGNTVDKGDSLTDDIFRAACLAIFALQNPDFDEILGGEGQDDVVTPGSLGVMLSKGSSAGNKVGEVGKTTDGQALGVIKSLR